MIATLKVWRGDNIALEVPLQACGIGRKRARCIGAPSMPCRELFGGWFRAGLKKL